VLIPAELGGRLVVDKSYRRRLLRTFDQVAGTILVRWAALARSTTTAIVAESSATNATIMAICHPGMPLATTVWVRVGLGAVGGAPDDSPGAGALRANAAGAEATSPRTGQAKAPRNRARWVDDLDHMGLPLQRHHGESSRSASNRADSAISSKLAAR